MKKFIITFLILFISISALAQVRLDFTNIYLSAERNPQLRIDAENLAISKGLPYNIYLKDKAMIEAVAIDNGKVVYSVITDFFNPFQGSYCTYYEVIKKSFDFSKARIIYGDRTIDNTGEQLLLNPRKTVGKLYLIPCMTSSRRNVWAFDYNTGDLVDSAFIPYSNPIIQTPRKVLQISRSRVIVADQLSDVVQLFDTSGAFIQTFAPSTGLNNSILDNIRDMTFRDNGNLLVTNAGTAGNSFNTVQQFSPTGVFLNTFASDSLNSPFNLLFRTNDLLVTNSSGIHNVAKFNKNTGAYIGDFIGSTLNFPEQMINLSGGRIGLVELSGSVAGIRIYDSLGVIKDTFKVVTGQRGIWQLPNGNYLTTNSVGIYEQRGTTGAVVRTIVSGYNFNCISVFDPEMVTVTNEIINPIPNQYRLYNNYPNPFNPSTKIKFDLPKSSFVSLKIFDITGREIANIVNENLNAGTYEYEFNVRLGGNVTLPSGIYFYRFIADGFSDTKKLMLIK